MDSRRMIKILKESYSLSELEDRLNIVPEDLMEGYEYLIEQRYEDILEMLREDLYYE